MNEISSNKADSLFALQAARYVLLSSGHQAKTYYATALYSLVEVEVPGLYEKAGGMLAVDKHWRLYYDPEMLCKFNDNLPALAGALEHEINHLLRDHAQRAEALNVEPLIWNLSSDCNINDNLLQTKAVFPYEVVTSVSLNQQFKLDLTDNETAESVYEKLYEKIPKIKISLMQPGGKSKGKEGIGFSCGSCADGQPREWEKPGPGEGKPGEEVPKGISPTEAQLIRAETAKQITELHNKGIGNIPGDLVRWAEGFFEPQVDWRRKLPHAIKRLVSVIRQGKMDYSFARRSRLNLPRVILPGMIAPQVNVDFFIDTSGSMDDADIGQPVAEAGAILRSMQGNIDLWVYSGDTGMSHAQKLTNPKKISLIGGGGTDMSQAAKDIEDRCKATRRSRDVLIVATDMLTHWHDKRPEFSRILVLNVGQGGTAPPWDCEVIDIFPKSER